MLWQSSMHAIKYSIVNSFLFSRFRNLFEKRKPIITFSKISCFENIQLMFPDRKTMLHPKRCQVIENIILLLSRFNLLSCRNGRPRLEPDLRKVSELFEGLHEKAFSKSTKSGWRSPSQTSWGKTLIYFITWVIIGC